MPLVELFARAGGYTKSAPHEAVVVRAGALATGPAMQHHRRSWHHR